MVKGKSDDTNSLTSWSDIIEKQGKDAQKKERATLKKMEEDLSGAIKLLGKASKDLLKLLNNWVVSSNPKIVECNQKFHDAVETEILRRMDKQDRKGRRFPAFN